MMTKNSSELSEKSRQLIENRLAEIRKIFGHAGGNQVAIHHNRSVFIDGAVTFKEKQRV